VPRASNRDGTCAGARGPHSGTSVAVNGRKQRTWRQKEKKKKAIAATRANQIQLRDQHSYSLESYQEADLPQLLARNNELGFFLQNTVVQLKDINSLEWQYPDMRFLVCSMSPTGSLGPSWTGSANRVAEYASHER
jgi:hypothetical protein